MLFPLFPHPVPQFLHLWLIPAYPAQGCKRTVARACGILTLAEEGPDAEESEVTVLAII